MLKRGDKVGRFTVLSDTEFIFGEGLGLGLDKPAQGAATVRVRCSCGKSQYVKVRALQQNLKKNPDTGCNSKACLNEYRSKKETP